MATRLPLVVILCTLLAGFGGPAGATAGFAGPQAPQIGTPGDWPMYGHDPSRTNYNPDETVLTAANVAQLAPRWQANLGSNGTPPSGAPSVANGRVYVGSSVASGPNFFAFDAVTGAPAWSTSVGYSNSDCFNVGIGATAAISGNVVVAGGGDAAYYGLNATTGAQFWRVPLNAGASGFAWASPVLAGSRAYIGVSSRCDNPSVRGEVRALDLAGGAQLTNQYFVPAGQAGAGIWNSPALSPDGNTLVVATGEDYNGYDGPYNRALVTLDAGSLAIGQANKQGAPGQDLDFGTTPVIFHDSSHRLLAGANHKDGNFYAYSLDTVAAGPLWSRATGTAVGMMPGYDPNFGAGGTLFIASDSGTLYAVDPATGADRWPPVSVGNMAGNLALANGLVFANTGDSVQVLDETTGAVLTSLVPAQAGAAYSGVVVAHGFVYWLSGAYLNAWSLPGAGATPTASGCTINFTDVRPLDYFYEPVRYLYCGGVLSGYADGTFRPGATTTRGQMVKIVVNAFAVPAYTPPAPDFADVPASDPFYAPIEAAAHAGIVSGYGDGTFRPSADVTRGQLAKITVTAAGWALQNPATGRFADVLPGTAFYSFVETAACHGIVSGYGCGGPGEPCDSGNRPYFRPGTTATRGQIAKIVYQARTGTQVCGPVRPR
ncbi:MAG TPA: S-layer homology domain-containing protein [Chloroflexia bacterium]|nr:S-layer homology domain-containing protein [Chloroflexia bacterium]